MTEFGVTPLGYSAHSGGPFNAFNKSHYSGGSSSGSAVAVALGLVPVAIGFDGGGSIRIPAAMEGVFGLATTYNRVPVDRPLNAMVKAGPIASSTRDAALAYAIMAEVELDHPSTELYGPYPGPPLPHVSDVMKTDLQGLRLGVFTDHFNDAQPVVVDACNKALSTLKKLGAEVVPIEIPHMRFLALAHGIGISADFTSDVGHLLYNSHNLEPSTRVQLGLGVSASSSELHAVNKLRGWAIQYIKREIFEGKSIHAVVSPTLGVLPPQMPTAALQTGESNTTLVVKLLQYIFLANLLGLPGMSVPVGYDKDTTLPIAIHFMGNHWEDAVLLRLSQAVEVHHLQRRRPKTFVDTLA